MFQRICSWSLTSVCAYILGTGCEIQKKHAVLLATLLPLFFYNMLSQHVRCPKLCNLRRKKTIWPDFKLLISLKLELDRGSSPMVRHNWISLEPAQPFMSGAANYTDRFKVANNVSRVWNRVSNHVGPWNNIARKTKLWEAARVDYF